MVARTRSLQLQHQAGSGSHVVRVTQLDRFDGIIAALVDGDFREAAF